MSSASARDAQASLPRARPALDESFSSGLGLGISVSHEKPQRASQRPASEVQHGRTPFQRTGPTASRIHRVHGMPSLATVDRIAINDVLEQYKPSSDESAMADTTHVSTHPGPSRPSAPLRASLETSSPSFLGAPTDARKDASLRASPPPEVPSAPGAHVSAPPAEPECRIEPSTSRIHIVGITTHKTAPRAETSRAEHHASMSPPGTNEIFPDGLFTSMPTPHLHDPTQNDKPTSAVPEEPVPPSRPVSWARTLQELSPRADESRHSIENGHDVDALLAEEPEEDSVDKLLQEDGLGIARSSTMRRIVPKEAARTQSPPPERLSVDLPTLPSWSPITLDGMLDDVPPASPPPYITRDKIRERVERRKTGAQSTSPALDPPARTAETRAPAPQDARPASAPPTRASEAVPRASSPAKPAARVLPTKEIPSRRETVRRDLNSPLAQFQSDMRDAAHDAPPMSAQAPMAHLSQTLARQATWFDDAGHTDAEHRASSSSSSDAPLQRDAEPAHEHRAASQAPPAAPTDELKDEAAADGPPTAFSFVMERELQRIVRESDQKYKVKERGVFADTPARRGGLGTHPAWMRLHKPTELTELMEQQPPMPTTVPDAQGSYTDGRLFLAMDAVTLTGPITPSQDTQLYCVLDNGIHRVKTEQVPLTPPNKGSTRIDQEFELIESPDFSLVLSVMLDGVATDIPTEWGGLGSDVPRTSVGRFLSKRLGTHHRETMRSPPLSEPYGRVFFALRDALPHCYARAFALELPIQVDSDGRTTLRRSTAQRLQRGRMRLRVLYLPPVPLVLESTLPGNMEEAMQGIESVAWHQTTTSYQGVLTQLGGDCLSWRRRPMRIVGLNLVCYNEVTRRPTTRIDLVQVVSVDECGPAAANAEHSAANDGAFPVPHSFCLSFRDGEKIYLFADTHESMLDWVRILRNIVAHKLTPPPAWALATVEAAQARAHARGPPSKAPKPPPNPPTAPASSQAHVAPPPPPSRSLPPTPSSPPPTAATPAPPVGATRRQAASQSPVLPTAPSRPNGKSRLRTVARRWLGRARPT